MEGALRADARPRARARRSGRTPPAGTPLRKHQIDALAGMLTELIAAAQRQEEKAASGHRAVGEVIGKDDGDGKPLPRR